MSAKGKTWLILILGGLTLMIYWRAMHGPISQDGPKQVSTPAVAAGYAGSSECRGCHERFYGQWAASRHGLAMQPYTKVLALAEFTAPPTDVVVGQYRYRAEVAGDTGWVAEEGPAGAKRYPLAHVLGGKNVYYFLTPVERGRLQVLPIAYDVRRREWFDTTASAVRHFRETPDEALHWRERPLTFNSSCHACHVSQMSLNYDLGKDSYHTVWQEPGINCETCHGPGSEHVRVCRAAAPGRAPADLKIVVTTKFSHEQINSLCAPCHAKMSPLTTGGQPGNRYFDHYDLAAFEDPDFYSDGRDLGENYTYTLWLTSPCVKSGRLDCLHCHTSSGRYRFTQAEANRACLPCHEDKAKNLVAHTHHLEGSAGSQCVACHMPRTEFARMTRTDHSMHSPTPAATLAYQSPNACNLCHTNQDAQWADACVRQWHTNDYQAAVLRQAGLIDAARKNNWTRLTEMLACVERPGRDEIFAASMVRLLANCESNAVVPVLTRALKDRSPLVRASAANTLGTRLTGDLVAPLLDATRDDYRLVRIRAASALAGAPGVPADAKAALDRADAEFESAMRARPDNPVSHYNLGNHYFSRNDPKRACAEFELALRLQPENLQALVNGSLAYNQMGNNERAETLLRQALRLESTNTAVNLNLGLLLGELGRPNEAIPFLRQTLKSDPKSDTAAYNLGVLLVKDQPAEALALFQSTAARQPENPKYAYTLAFYLNQQGQASQATALLQGMVDREFADPTIYSLLGEILERQGKANEAAAIYRQAAANEKFPGPVREQFRRTE